MAKHKRAGSRAVGGLLALALVTTACQHGGDHALKVTGGAGVPATAPSPDTDPTPPSTSGPVPSTTASPQRLRAASATTRGAGRAAAAASPAAALTRLDTGLTRVRLVIDNRADWTSVTLDGTNIVTARVVDTAGTRVTSLGPTISVADPGQAVIDLVLNVPQGASPVLSVCKNYLAPATVTVTRLTNAATQVAALTDTGTDPTNTNGCENPMRIEMGRAALIGPVRWPARQDPRPLVLANYYPWYDSTNAGKDFGDNPVGPVDTSNPDTVAAAIALAAKNGIDGFIVEYDGTPSFAPRIDAVYQIADARHDFQAALMIDLAILQRRPDGLSDAALDSAFDAAAARAGRSSQLRKDGAPVVFVYAADKVDPARWQAAIDRQRAAGFAPFVIADDAALGSPGRFSYSTNDAPDLSALLRWASSALFDLRVAPGVVGQHGPLWVAPVSPGYDDRRLHRSQPRYVDRQGGQRYADSWSAAIDALPDWLMVTSWNEYYEQTHVMAGTASGTKALEQTAAAAADFHRTG